MQPLRALAPGKLVLVGEYAVLDGAPAVVASIDRGVSCEATPGGAEILIEAPDERFARPALEAVRAPAGRYRFANWNPTDLPDKPGFGGSAAATVAACAAGLAARGLAIEPARLEAIALRVHHAVQGSGSGIDVRAAARGGVIRVEGAAPPAALDATLPLVAIYSGVSASTGPRVRRYRGWASRDPAGAQRFVDASRAIVDAFAADPADAFRANYALLREMAAAAGVAYDTPGLARIAALAEAFGGAAKPSGAGGGDVAVALLPDPAARDAFAAACAAAGLPPIPVRIVSGVSVSSLG